MENTYNKINTISKTEDTQNTNSDRIVHLQLHYYTSKLEDSA